MVPPIRLISPEALPELYTRLYSERRFDAWRELFDDGAIVIRTDASGRLQRAGIDAATARYAQHAARFRNISETWTDVDIRIHGDLATVSARYCLSADEEVREGVDLLTLSRRAEGWKIVCLAYQQTHPAALSRASAAHLSPSGDRLPENLADLLTLQAQRAPGGAAVRLRDGTITFERLEQLVWCCAQHLTSHGVREGDVIGLSLSGESEAVVAMLAIARLGATVFWIPPRATPELRERMREGIAIRWTVTDTQPPTEAPGNARWLRLDVDELGRMPMHIDPGIRAARPRAPWMIITGSGSTGRPRRLPVSHRQFVEQMHAYGRALSISPRDRIGSMLGLDTVVTRERYLDAVLSGASVVTGGTHCIADPNWMRDTGVTVLWSTVVHAELLLDRLARQGEGSAPETLRAFVVGSATVSGGLRARLLRVFARQLHVYYGTNEVGLATLATPEDLRVSPLTVGRAAPGIEVEVVNADHRALPCGEPGEIRIRAPGMIEGYFDDPEATRAAFRDGWFHPGDLGALGPDGLLDHHGRTDDLMIADGINVYPAEIERTLTGIAGVAEAAAFPLPHPVHQDVPVAAVVLEDGCMLTPERLTAQARLLLGPRAPARVVVVPDIPRNPQGKPIRDRLQQRVAQALRETQPSTSED